ncbi:MAG: hypothetical protein VXB94_05965, partial [Rhodobiaceae bacterium]
MARALLLLIPHRPVTGICPAHHVMPQAPVASVLENFKDGWNPRGSGSQRWRDVGVCCAFSAELSRMGDVFHNLETSRHIGGAAGLA